MGAGLSAGTAAGSFLQGLTSTLSARRQERREDEARKEERRRGVVTAMINAVKDDVPDASFLEPLFVQLDPEAFGPLAGGKKGKDGKAQTGFSQLAPYLAPMLAKPGAAATASADASLAQEDAVAAGTGAPPVLPGRPAVGPGTMPQGSPASMQSPGEPVAPVRNSFFGVELMSPGEKAQQQVDAQIEKESSLATSRVAMARRLLPMLKEVDPTVTLEDALRYVSKGELMTNASQRAAAGSTYRYGVDREAIAKAVFGKGYGELTKEESQVVLDQEKQMLEAESNARGTGTAQAKFNAPADLSTAQRTGVTVGTSAADVAGKNVPTAPEREQQRAMQTLKADITNIAALINKVLPSKNELAGNVPGAVVAVRKRMNSYREDFAALDSAVQSILNTLARARGQRGAQSDRDIDLATAALVDLRTGLSDPFGGDTRESAGKRIEQTIQALDRILAVTPTVPVAGEGAGAPAKSGAAAAPAKGAAAPVAGIYMDPKTGKLIDKRAPAR